MSVKENETETTERKVFEDELFESLIIGAQFIPGDNRIFDDGRDIPWLDMDLAQSGQEFFHNHYTSLLIAHVLYFGFSFGFKPLTGVVYKSGGLKGIDGVTKRFLSTIWHALSWYEHDIIGTYSTGTKAITNVRKTHETIMRKCARPHESIDFAAEEKIFQGAMRDPIATSLKEDMKFLDTGTYERMDLTYDPPQPMSQFSMAWVQLAFFLPVFAQASGFGIHDTRGVEGFEHLWALIGHLTGIEDRFNIPLQKPGKAFYARFFKEVFLPSLLVRDTKVDVIQKSFFKSSKLYLPQMSIPGSLYFFLKQSKLEGFNGTELYKLMTLRDKITSFCIRIMFWMFRWSVIRWVVNLVVRSKMEKVLAKYAKEEEAEGRNFTYLPHDTKWSVKYRKRSDGAIYKWKKADAMLWAKKVLKKKPNRGLNK